MAQRTRRGPELAVEMRPTDAVKPYEANPRQNDQAVEAVANSIREFGFRQPIVVDADGLIIVGHTRWKAAKALGLEKVPVHVARGLTPEQVRAYRLADNATRDLSEWNYDLLPIELGELKDAGFELALLGFSEDGLAKALNAAGLKDGLTDPDAIPEPPDAARMLGVALQAIQEDLDAGAPRNADGTLNLVHYAAWLNLTLLSGGDPDGEA